MKEKDKMYSDVVDGTELDCYESYDNIEYVGNFNCPKNSNIKAEIELSVAPIEMEVPDEDSLWFYFSGFNLGPHNPEISLGYALTKVKEYADKHKSALLHEIKTAKQRQLEGVIEKMGKQAGCEKHLDPLKQQLEKHLAEHETDFMDGMTYEQLIDLHLQCGFVRWDQRDKTVLYFPDKQVREVGK